LFIPGEMLRQLVVCGPNDERATTCIH